MVSVVMRTLWRSCVGVVGALSAFYHNGFDVENVDHREITAIRLIAKVPTLAAWSLQIHSRSTIRLPT